MGDYIHSLHQHLCFLCFFKVNLIYFFLQNLYKKSTLLLRSLYATVRLLPAYRIFRDLNSFAKICPFTLAHRVSSFVEPFARKEKSEMMKYKFTPVDTSSGSLCLTVMYCPSASDLSCDPLPSMSPQVISDYVGSPLASPLRRFPSLPYAGFPCHESPPPRRHSSNFDDRKASTTSITDSSLPIYIQNHTYQCLIQVHGFFHMKVCLLI